jgi:hypothetical protein
VASFRNATHSVIFTAVFTGDDDYTAKTLTATRTGCHCRARRVPGTAWRRSTSRASPTSRTSRLTAPDYTSSSSSNGTDPLGEPSAERRDVGQS